MLQALWKAKRHWSRLCRCEIFLTHEMNLLPVQNPCKAELLQSEGNFFSGEYKFLTYSFSPAAFFTTISELSSIPLFLEGTDPSNLKKTKSPPANYCKISQFQSMFQPGYVHQPRESLPCLL